ncbi:hypothetical protein BDZ97DRAFT_1918013 [Flammula alnicola]|nr:hypothetical protein BDZ97DRAFT_1918013 [Flammula alnicola]
MEPGDEAELIRCHPMLDDFFDYIAWFTPPENLEPHFSSILRNISRGLDFSLDSQGYETADFVFFCARLYMEKVAHHSWFSSMMKFGPFSLRRRILDLLTRMIQYEHQLDKPRYCSRYAFWMSGLRVRRSRGIDASMFGVSYEPIPEDLLRFVPYDRKDSEDPSLKIEGHSPGTPSGEMQNLHSPGLIEYAEAWSTGITDSDHYG